MTTMLKAALSSWTWIRSQSHPLLFSLRLMGPEVCPSVIEKGEGMSMKNESTASTVAIVGAGNSGVVCAKVIGGHGLDVAVFEKGSQLGGLCIFGNDKGMSSICRPLNINTSNRMMQLPDYPMSVCGSVRHGAAHQGVRRAQRPAPALLATEGRQCC